MNRDIGDLVSRIFYPAPSGAKAGTLQITTAKTDEPHGFIRPDWLGDGSLLWLDTGALPSCADEPAWKNRGEVEVIDEFVSHLDPVPQLTDDDSGRVSLAVLTPYRHQTDLLRGRDSLRSFVHTVHAFQGREAETVVVSLVRDKTRGSAKAPWKNMGHLVQPDLANVMCSRARRLLVLVGDFDHFAKSGVAFWEQLCEVFAEHRAVLPAGRVFRG
jgi:hypothetical protein